MEESVDFETAFIVVKTFDNNFFATTELGSEFSVERTANRNDITQAVKELGLALDAERVVSMLLAALRKTGTENSQPNEPEIRQPLPEDAQ